MNEQKGQFDHMTPEEAKAALGISTRLYEEHLHRTHKGKVPDNTQMADQPTPASAEPQQPQPTDPNAAQPGAQPGQATPPAEQEPQDNSAQAIENLRTDMHNTIKTEIAGLRDEIIKAISNEQEG